MSRPLKRPRLEAAHEGSPVPETTRTNQGKEDDWKRAGWGGGTEGEERRGEAVGSVGVELG